jgi:REP element-mobilizing transposase RayT
MPRKLRKQYPGAKYHITARGVGGKNIFARDADRERFLGQLEYALDTDDVVLYAYALMQNHYHLLVETPLGNIGAFEHRLNTAYSTYYRLRRKWKGHVLQHRYGGKLVHGDGYLVAVTRYIHLNPVKIAAMRRASEPERLDYLNRYPWSSYRGYVQKRHEEDMVNYRWRELMGVASESRRRAAYRQYVERFISKDDDKTLTALELSPYAIGDKAFIDEIEKEMNEQRSTVRARADIVWPKMTRPDIDDVERAVAKEFGVGIKALSLHGRRVGPAKRVAVEFACRLCGLTQRAAGERYGSITCAAVGKLRRKLAGELREDADLRRRVARMEESLDPRE